MPEEKAGRLLEDSWQKKPRITCWLWSFCSFRSCEVWPHFPSWWLLLFSLHTAPSPLSSDWCTGSCESRRKQKDSCSETLFGPAVTVKSSSQTDTAHLFLASCTSSEKDTEAEQQYVSVIKWHENWSQLKLPKNMSYCSKINELNWLKKVFLI